VQNSTTSLVAPGNLRVRISPDTASTVTASTLRACTSRPAQLRTCAMVGSSYAIVAAARWPPRGKNTRPIVSGGPATITTAAGRQPHP